MMLFTYARRSEAPRELQLLSELIRRRQWAKRNKRVVGVHRRELRTNRIRTRVIRIPKYLGSHAALNLSSTLFIYLLIYSTTWQTYKASVTGSIEGKNGAKTIVITTRARSSPSFLSSLLTAGASLSRWVVIVWDITFIINELE